MGLVKLILALWPRGYERDELKKEESMTLLAMWR